MPRRSNAFTLIELLVVISIIGLLVGLLAVVGGQAINRSREFAVTTEMTQMEHALESFKTKYGFYPPSFEQFSRETTAASPVADINAELNQFIPYLARVAPNHQQSLAQLQNWWVNVGVNLDQRSSLVFWLSGLPVNRQFPLTHPVDGSLLTAYDNGTVERQSLYAFESDRLRDVFDGSGAVLPNVQGYEMAHGKQNGALLFVYRDAGSYVPRLFAHPSSGVLNPLAYDRTDPTVLALAYHADPTLAFPPAVPSADSFVNPDSFQLICFGLDGDGGEPINKATGDPAPELRGILDRQGAKAADNLCNFAEGRLDKYVTDVTY